MEENTLPVSQLQQLAENTNNALTLNKQSVDNAQKFGQELIEKIKQQGMNETLDQECNNFLVKCKRTHELMNERRKPATQLFDQVKKYFTDLENQLDPAKGEIYLTIQGYRNDYARQLAEIARKKEEESRRKLEIEKAGYVAHGIGLAFFIEVRTSEEEAWIQLQQIAALRSNRGLELCCYCVDRNGEKHKNTSDDQRC